MASSSSSLSLLLLLLCLSSLPPPLLSHITIPLEPHNPPSQDGSSPDPLQALAHLAKSSLNRAHHLKHAHPQPHRPIQTQTPLSPRSYGAYSASLRFGTPPQPLPFILDTGSDLVWFPCTRRYLCRNCSSPSPIPSFIPRLSSSSKLVGCANPKCRYIHPSSPPLNCTTSRLCPPYLLLYGSGSTGGVLLSETLTLPGNSYPDLAVGCSLFSSRAPSGIAGFGRGPASLPSQLRLSKFSYCLVSHQFDNSNRSSALNLAASAAASKTPGAAYTNFLPNPTAGRPEFGVYYYLGLRRISVGGRRVKIPAEYLTPGADGNGGVIVDSGSTFTFMEGAVFGPVARAVVKEVESRYNRLTGTEERVGLSPCFNVSGERSVTFPKLVLHFKGGADMELPLQNYFAYVGRGSDAVCMTVLTDGGDAKEGVSGPAVILGNHQMQNFYVEYDLKNNRFGFRRQVC